MTSPFELFVLNIEETIRTREWRASLTIFVEIFPIYLLRKEAKPQNSSTPKNLHNTKYHNMRRTRKLFDA